MEREKELSNEELNSMENMPDKLIGIKVLVVEDNLLNLEIVTEVLRERGLIVTCSREWADCSRVVSKQSSRNV